MERWSGRVALVTGASVGIGAAIAVELAKNGLTVVGLARRVDKIQELSKGLQGCKGKLLAVKADMTKEEDILAAFKWIKDNVGGVDVLVNNAGVFIDKSLSQETTDDWRRMLDVNVLGLCICSREAVNSMKERGVDDGHIVHISSVAGHMMPPWPIMAFYSATKHAVQALTEGLRKDLLAANSKIRVSCISPGGVDTEGVQLLLKDPKNEAFKSFPKLKPEDVASAVIFALAAPPHVQILEVVIKPVGEVM